METTPLKAPDWPGVKVTFALQQFVLADAMFKFEMLSGGCAVTEEVTKGVVPKNCRGEESGVVEDVAKLKK